MCRRIILTFVIATTAHLLGTFLLMATVARLTQNDPPAMCGVGLHPLMDFCCDCYEYPFSQQTIGTAELFKGIILNALTWGAAVSLIVGPISVPFTRIPWRRTQRPGFEVVVPRDD
jgi:hypothetical protein